MMQANELRIDNWITWATNDMEGGILHKPVVVSGNLIKEIQLHPYLGYNGIPLTPEILEKCGFEGTTHRKFKKIGKTPLTIYYEKGVVSIEDYDWFDQDLRHIKFVHQIQNLYFSLANEELQVNL